MDFIVKLIRRYQKIITYGFIGLAAVAVDYGIFVFSFSQLGLSPLLSNIISVLIATIFSFTTNAFLNFKTTDRIYARMISFFAVSLLGLILSTIAIKVLIIFFSVDPRIAKLVSLPPIVLIQYLLNSRVTFGSILSKHKKAQTPKTTVKIPTDKTGKHIAVIGAGFTGLTTAYELLKKGHDVTLLEKSSEIGGLVSGFELEGVPIEKAYHFLYKTDADIIGLTEELGIRDKLVFHQSSLGLYYDGVLYPFMTPKDLLSFTPLSFIDRLRAGLTAVYLSKRKNWQGFAKITAMDWMRKWAGKRVTEVIWEPILRGKFFDYFDKVAMSYVWSRVFVRAASKDPGDVTEKLGYFTGGWTVLVKALEDKIKELGGLVQCNTTLTGIRSLESRQTKISFDGQPDQNFDATVATIPTYIFSKLIKGDTHATTEYLDFLKKVDYIGAITLVFATDKPFTNYYWHNVNDVEHPFLVLLSLSSLVGPERLDGKHIYYIGAYLPHDHELFAASKQDIYDQWMQGVTEIFPQFEKDSVTSWDLFKFKDAQHIVDTDYASKIPAYESQLPNVYLANFSQIFPDDRGTNYAVQEGVKIAHLIDSNLKERS